jgi:capsular polysaccharide biosynthesis protein
VELRRYLRVISRHRRLTALAFLVTSVATFVLVFLQPPVYESTGTALIHPRLRDQGDAIDASDLLIRGVKIGETYATVARSSMIRDRAEDTLDPDLKVSGIAVAAEVVTDTNVLSISARGTDPVAAQALSAAVMDATVNYSISLSDAYVISPLDAPEVADTPVGPNKGLTIAIGLILALLLAVVAALFAEYLRGGLERQSSAEDERTGLLNEGFLSKRLWEEISRADRTDRTFALASFRVGLRRSGDDDDGWRPPSDPDLRRIGELLPLTASPEVVIAHLGGGAFGAILPDMDRPAAYRMLARWEAGIGAVLDSHVPEAAIDPRFAEGICLYRSQAFDGDREAIRLARQLTDREVATVVRGPQARAETARHEPDRGEPDLGTRSGRARGRHEPIRLEPDRPEPIRLEPDGPEPDRQQPVRPARRQRTARTGGGSRRAAVEVDELVDVSDDTETQTAGPERPQAGRQRTANGGGSRRAAVKVDQTVDVSDDVSDQPNAQMTRPEQPQTPASGGAGQRSSASKGKPRAATPRR